ncbi:MAG: hypothetical protein U5R31_04950 [Acidimicrobiia bacterium]|nr:hypothetical protein [Acidimicrobiia bacterium]
MATRRGRWEPPTFDTDERARLKRWLWLAIAGLVVIGVALVYVGEPMTAEGGANIVTYELADSGERAEEILDGWGPEGRDAARWSLILDYGWLVSYGAVLLVGSVLVAEMARDRGWTRVRRLGWLVAGLALAAALLDAVENTALLWQLSRGGTDVAALVARFAAGLKFLFVALAILYLVVAGITAFFRRPEAERLEPQTEPRRSSGEQSVTISRRE